MVTKIYLSPLAARKLVMILESIEKKWNQTIRYQFLEDLKLKRDQIIQHPLSCPETKFKKGVFKAVINEHNSFYYRIKNDEIEIITFSYNQQDPKDIEKELTKFSS
jgi:plasmid stabilization system protein ParE